MSTNTLSDDNSQETENLWNPHNHESDSRFEIKNKYISKTLWGIYVNYGRGKNAEVNQYACYINY